MKPIDARKTAYATRVRLTPGDEALLKRLAADHGVSGAEVIRRCLRAVADGEPFDVMTARRIEMQLRKIGTNLNQIARRYNSGKVVSDDDLAIVLGDVAEILARTVRTFRDLAETAREQYRGRMGRPS